VVWVSDFTVHSFALYSGARFRIERVPERSVGFWPRFDDPRIHQLGWTIDEREAVRSVADAEHVYVVHEQVAPNFTPVLFDFSILLAREGFEPESYRAPERTMIARWVRNTPLLEQ
jgi:hypothetical protein